MYNIETFFMPEYSNYQRICEIISFNRLTEREIAKKWFKCYLKVAYMSWLKGDLKVA